MQNLTLAATRLTPQIQFDYASNRLAISGESYPEDVITFYGPILASLQAYLFALVQTGSQVFVELSLTYINSASTKSFQQLLGMLDFAAKSGAKVSVAWVVNPDDETMQELGEDLLCDKHWLSHEIVRRQVV